MADFPSAAGGGAGSGFQLFTQSDNNSGIYADAAARDVYFGANPDDLARLDADESLIIKLLDDGFGDVAYQQRSGGNWVDVTSLVQGETGAAGATGNSYFFESITARDDFFSTSPNETLLMQDLPITVNTDGNTVTSFVWKGGDAPVSYDNTLWQRASIQSGTGSFILGDAHIINSAGENVAFSNLQSGINYHPAWQTYGDGNTATVRVRTTLPPITVSDKTADLVNPVWDNGAPASADQTVKQVIVDFVNPVTNLIVDLELDGVNFFRHTFGSFGTGEQAVVLNPPVDVKGGQLVTFTLTDESGADVVIKGSNAILDTMGRPIPFQEATIATWDDITVAIKGEVISEDPRNFYFAKGGDDAKAGTTIENANLTIGESIDKANALSPPPQINEAVAIISIGFGLYLEGITMPPFSEINAPLAEIVATTGHTITLSSNSTVNMAAVGVIEGAMSAIFVDDVNDAIVSCRGVTVIGVSSNGIHVTGTSSNIFVDIGVMRLEGLSSAGIFDNSSSGTPRIYNIDEISLEAGGCLGIDFLPSNAAAEAIVNIGAITVEGSPSGVIGIKVSEGVVTATVNEIQVGIAISVETGGTLNITANKVIGNIFINGTGILNCEINEHIGVLSVAQSATITGTINNTTFGNTDVEGDFTATGTIEAGV